MVRLPLVSLLAASLAACNRPPPPSPAAPALEGRLSVVRNGHLRVFLADDAGAVRELEMSNAALARAGGPLALDGRRVRVFGRASAGARVAVDSLFAVSGGARP